MHPVSYFAYLDAGTGSLIIQSVVGIVAAIGVFMRRTIFALPHKIKSFFKRGQPTGTAGKTKDSNETKQIKK